VKEPLFEPTKSGCRDFDTCSILGPLLFAFLLTFLLSNHCSAQRSFLMLQKKNRNKNAYYGPGDEISFRIKDRKRKISGEILEFRDSVIVFRGFEIPVAAISSLYIDEKTKWWLRYKIEQVGLLAGGGYLILDLINTGELTRETVVVSSSLIAVGLMAKLLIGNRIKIKGRTKLRILKL
jgi:hypothetical protein